MGAEIQPREVVSVVATAADPLSSSSPSASSPSPKMSQEIVMANLELSDVPRVRTKLRITAILVALYLSVFLAALDQTIIATAIPTIASQLHSASGYFWVGGAYLLADAAAGPIWAKLSDIWGRKPALLACVALFGGASILAALSVSMRMLIAARALQGAAGGGLIQLCFITVSDLFSMRRRALFLGLVEVVWALAGGAGPLIGGALTQLVSWRWCFWINLPVCALALALLTIFLDVHNPRTRLRDGLRAIDWLGTLSILGVTVMLLLGLDFGGALFPWSSATVICLIIFGVLMGGFFVYTEHAWAKYPLMPLAMFATRSNAAAFGVCGLHACVFIATKYYLPLYFQAALQASPLRSGLLILPNTVPEALVGIGAGVLIHQTGRYRELIWGGLVLLTLGTGLFISFTSDTTSTATIVVVQIIGGIGSGALFEAPLLPIQNSVAQSECASATAAFGFIRSMACAVSTVVGGVIFQNSMNGQIGRLQGLGVPERVLGLLGDGQAAANVEVIATIEDGRLRGAVKEAFALSLRNMWILYVCLAGLGLGVSGFISHQALSREHTETRTGLGEMKERWGGGAVVGVREEERVEE